MRLRSAIPRAVFWKRMEPRMILTVLQGALYVFVIWRLLRLSGTMSGASTVLTSIDPMRLEKRAFVGDKKAALVAKLIENPREFVATAQLTNTFSNNLCALTWGLLFSLLIGLLQTSMSPAFLTLVGTGLAGAISTLVTFLYGELFPTAKFQQDPIENGARCAALFRRLTVIEYPLIQVCLWLVRRRYGEMPEIEKTTGDQALAVEAEFQASRNPHISDEELRLIFASLEFDDMIVLKIAQELKPNSVITLKLRRNKKNVKENAESRARNERHASRFLVREPVWPTESTAWRKFVSDVKASGKTWITIATKGGGKGNTDRLNTVLNADRFRVALEIAEREGTSIDPAEFCHRPIQVDDVHATMESVLEQIHVDPNDVFERHIIIYWNGKRMFLDDSMLLNIYLRLRPQLEELYARRQKTAVPVNS